MIILHHTWSRYLADMGRFDDAHTSVRRLYGIEAGPFETHETVTHELNTLPTRSAAEREGTGFVGCFTTATRWRPSFMLLYALVTSAHSGGGLQVRLDFGTRTEVEAACAAPVVFALSLHAMQVDCQHLTSHIPNYNTKHTHLHRVLKTLYRIHPILEKLALSSEDHDVDYIITM
jgi:hypothetical protein